MSEPSWMTEAIKLIQRHAAEQDQIERARMEIAIYRHLQAQRDAVLEEARGKIELRLYSVETDDWDEAFNAGLRSALTALKP